MALITRHHQTRFSPLLPANNKYLAHRWDLEIFNAHRKKVSAAKAVIDNNPPRVHMHLYSKLKKLQIEAERLATIERDNRLLLEKMAHIMRTGGLVDHKKLDHTHKSLNKIKRQRELLRISHENLAILKRLMTKDPHYNSKKWFMEWQVNQQFLMNISKYPHLWRKEQGPYLDLLERQLAANRLISSRISSPTKSGRSMSIKSEEHSPRISRLEQGLELLCLRPGSPASAAMLAIVQKTSSSTLRPGSGQAVKVTASDSGSNETCLSVSEDLRDYDEY